MASVLKNKFVSTVAGTALSVAGALGMANAAFADDSSLAGRPATAHQTSILEQRVATATENLPASYEQIQVPVSDARHVDIKVVGFTAAQMSGGGYITLVVKGQDQAVFDATYKASQQLIANLFPVRGIFVTGTDQPAEIMIHIAGDGTYQVRNDLLRNYAGITRAVAEGYKETVGALPKENPNNPLLLSQVTEPAPSLAQNQLSQD